MKSYEFVNFEDSLATMEHINKAYRELGKIDEGLGPLTFTFIDELVCLYELARNAALPQSDDGCIFECGTWFGFSAVVMAQGLKESRLSDYPVFTVDSYPADRGQLEKRKWLTLPEGFDWLQWQRDNPQQTVFRSIVHRLELSDYVVSVAHDSVRYLKLFNLPIRLAFIDSSHDVATCHSEALLIKKLLVPGGAIVFHDREYWQVDKVLKALIPDENYEVLSRLAIWRP